MQRILSGTKGIKEAGELIREEIKEWQLAEKNISLNPYLLPPAVVLN